MHGFHRVAAARPRVIVADVAANRDAVRAMSAQAAAQGCALVVFPELCLTGYTCGDLFQQPYLLAAARQALLELAADDCGATVRVVGLPLQIDGRLYNVAAVLQKGRIAGIVPKSFLPNYKEFYEKRWFVSGMDRRGGSVRLGDADVPFGVDLLFDAGDHAVLGVEICEDLWNVLPPSSFLACAGATLIANPSASPELVAKAEYRRDLVAQQSARCVCAYVYSGAGCRESSTDLVYGGDLIIAENGVIWTGDERFGRDPVLLDHVVDLDRLQQTRATETSFGSNPLPTFRRIPLAPVPACDQPPPVDPNPFVPRNPAAREARCREILQIQTTGLQNRLEHIGCQTTVIGISGGLDSTLALLVTAAAWRGLGQSCERIVAVTMPGFGTTDRTYQNAVALCRKLGADFREINIVDASLQHFSDIGHDPDVHDVTYENVQARERTQILMNLANKHAGIVIGTGDLSEIALGWSTYNGDHMSMYAVNCGVPKTLIRYLIEWVADHDDRDGIGPLLHDILDTPISPELLPRGAGGEMLQKTEDVIGPYTLHDFFLYHAVKYGAPPQKILCLAEAAYGHSLTRDQIRHWLRTFYRRFFTNQFKRSCIPDGPKVGSIALSPRGDWRMPSDAAARLWLQSLDEADS